VKSQVLPGANQMATAPNRAPSGFNPLRGRSRGDDLLHPTKSRHQQRNIALFASSGQLCNPEDLGGFRLDLARSLPASSGAAPLAGWAFRANTYETATYRRRLLGCYVDRSY